MMNIQINQRDVYGRTLYYPMDNAAKHLANIAGTATLTFMALRSFYAMGGTIELVDKDGATFGRWLQFSA